jgi:hypothetical protein
MDANASEELSPLFGKSEREEVRHIEERKNANAPGSKL